MNLSRLITALFLAVPLAPLAAHEFWIVPEKYQVAPGSAIRADFKNGQEFKGNTLSYFEGRSARFETALGDDVKTVEARAGDAPALQMTAPDADGLLVVLHETTPSTISYKEWEKFAKFATHKDFPDAEADHTAAGWPRDGFRETYTRHIKSLIAVGNGAGSDKSYGMATEFVAVSNPYAPEFDDQMVVTLLYNDQPRADAQVEVFDQDTEGAVTISLHRTDTSGTATIPVMAGHSYLFDAVVLRPAADAGSTENAPVWETLWAALTFAVPQ
ncbi:MAG: DUF4198 domain-containing protein [Sulfitobacter sp.]